MAHDDDGLIIKKPRRARISAVWIVPIVAAVLGAAVMWQSLANQGPLVEIRFDDAKGVEPDKTEIKHKDVVIGVVEEVRFTENLDAVIVSARLDKEVEPYLGETTDFWIVSADVSGGDFSGLGTILSGSYIEMDWSARPNQSRRAFEGLENAPLTPPGVEGRHVKLQTSRAGSVVVGSPVSYRGIQVGRVEERAMSKDFRSIEYTAFVEAPYDELVVRATKFWDVSGVTLNAGADGFSVDVASLEALVMGGVEFGEIGAATARMPARDDRVFEIFPSREAASESLFSGPDQERYLFTLSFPETLTGLDQGAPVEWQGIRVGTVEDLILDLDAERPEDIVRVVIALQPRRIGLNFASPKEAQASIDEWVGMGMRARLATGNLLTGKKVIRLVDAVGDDDAAVNYDASPYPELPTAPSELDAVAQNAEELVQTLAALPLDELLNSAIRLLDNAGAVAGDPALRELPSELNATVASLGALAGNLDAASRDLPTLIASLNDIADVGESTLAGLSPDSQLYVELSGAVSDLRDAARSLSALAARLDEQPNALITGRN